MATKLEADQKLKRLVKIYGIEGDVEVAMSLDGLALRIPGTKTSTMLSWTAAVNASETPMNVKSFHAGRPFEFLRDQAKGVVKRRVERAG